MNFSSESKSDPGEVWWYTAISGCLGKVGNINVPQSPPPTFRSHLEDGTSECECHELWYSSYKEFILRSLGLSKVIWSAYIKGVQSQLQPSWWPSLRDLVEAKPPAHIILRVNILIRIYGNRTKVHAYRPHCNLLHTSDEIFNSVYTVIKVEVTNDNL